MNKVLIIDGNNTMHRAYHAYARLTNQGKPVNIIYGMPQLVNALIHQFQPDDVYICWDEARHKERLRLCPEYKAKRKTKTKEQIEDMMHQKKKVIELFNSLGIKQLIGKGMEADDYIYALVRRLRKSNQITIVSTDKDFHQLLRPSVRIFNTAKHQLIHHKNLKALFGYSPEQCVDYLSLLGDDSDNIKGYRGMGDERIKIFLAEFGSIKAFIENESSSFMKLDKVALRKLYITNKMLINLKTFYNKHLKDKITLDFGNSKFNKKVLFKICDNYNIKALKETKFTKNYNK